MILPRPMMWTLFLLAALCGAGCGRDSAPPERTVRIAGEPTTIRGRVGHTEALHFTTDSARQLNDRIFPLIDVYAPFSEISRANQIAAQSRFPISTETQRLLEYSLQLSHRLDGLFDPTDAALRHLWEAHFRTRPEALLSEPLIQAARVGVGAENIEIRSHALLFLSPRTQLDVNDFLRPYLIDLSIIQTRQQGFSDILITQGHTGRGLGRLDTRTPWTVPIPNPQAPDESWGDIVLSDGLAFAIRGLPEDYVQIGGQRISRMVDPRNGWPAAGEALVITLGPVAADAYALAQALFIEGPALGMQRMIRMPRYHACFIAPGTPPRVMLTAGSESLFRFHPERHFDIQIVDRSEAEERL